MEEIKQRRQKEITEGKNASTIHPIYVVYDEIYTVCEASSEYDQTTTVFETPEKYVRHDGQGGEKVAEKDTTNWEKQIEKWSPVVKKSFHDQFVTVCFTRKDAEDFIRAEKHNLRNPRIYVHSAESRNTELNEILSLMGD